MAKINADVVISWYSENKETQALRASFERPTRFIQMPAGPGTDYPKQIAAFGQNALQNLIAQKLPDITPMRVALMGFSEGCQGVRAALKCGDGGRVDAALAIDGIHTQWVKKGETFSTGLLLPWGAIGERAASGSGASTPLLVVTTSDVKPDYVSTTVTSNWIWSRATGLGEISSDIDIPSWASGPVEPPYVNSPGSFGPGQAKWPETVYSSFPLRAFRKQGGLWILNYWNLDPTGVGDHRFQAARVSPMVMRQVLIQRWNQMDPFEGILVGSSTAADPLPLGSPGVASVQSMLPDQKTGVDGPDGGGGQGETPSHPDADSGSSGIGSFLVGVGLGVAAALGAKKFVVD